jgi:[FeFe] hydrogenase H-cluster maturation GTPase HydF
MRLQIGLFGRRNSGKSSLLNAITRQHVAIVSEVAGTTTDAVEKPMELLPLGPVLFVDTAGVDDEGALGALRIERTRLVFDRVDLGVVVAEAGRWGEFEEGIIGELARRNVPVLVAFNKADLAPFHPEHGERLSSAGIPWVAVSALEGSGMTELREALLRLAPSSFLDTRAIVSDLVPQGDVAVLVVPIDKQAPKGRLILPQAMTIRDLLDNGSLAMVTDVMRLSRALERLTHPPALVVTDSQAFAEVAEAVPVGVRMTSFSILMARFQGDLATQVRGTRAIDHLRAGDRVLVAETCTHHPTDDDIGRVKIPRWLNRYVGGAVEFSYVQGRDFPADVTPYNLVIHCGNCTGNRREMLSRIHRCSEAGVPITNYGLTIARTLGILERALEPFPAALEAWHAAAA